MIAACYIIHYGKEWLKWSIRSVVDSVGEVHIFYTSTPSHGHVTTLVNPDTKSELISIVAELRMLGCKIEWHDCPSFRHEGEHRTYAVNTCEELGADTVLVVDADELWAKEDLEEALTHAVYHRTYRVSMRHFWRSLKWVCYDAAMPTRIINLKSNVNTEGYINPEIKAYHMGYAQTPRLIEYKQSIHGHKAEWREGWFENTFMAWHPGMEDVHPTCVNYWTPKEYNDDGKLKWLCGDHPYWGLDIIE